MLGSQSWWVHSCQEHGEVGRNQLLSGPSWGKMMGSRDKMRLLQIAVQMILGTFVVPGAICLQGLLALGQGWIFAEENGYLPA